MQNYYYFLYIEDEVDMTRFVDPTIKFQDLINEAKKDYDFRRRVWRMFDDSAYIGLEKQRELRGKFFREIEKSESIEDYSHRALDFLKSINDNFEIYNECKEFFEIKTKTIKVISENENAEGTQQFCYPFTKIIIPNNSIIDIDKLDNFGFHCPY